VLTGTFKAQHPSTAEGINDKSSAQLLHLIGISEQREHTVAEQISRSFLTSYHRDDGIGHYFFIGQAIAVDLGRKQGEWGISPSRGGCFCSRSPP